MKKITKEEFDNLTIKHRNPIMSAISKMEIGDMILIEKGEYHCSSPFRQWVGSMQKFYNTRYNMNVKISVNTLQGETGWVVTRKE